MNGISPYYLLIGISIIVILSYFFNQISKKTSIPSVLLLIVLGVILNYFNQFFGVIDRNFMPLLEILGIVGLIMIVLEAALDLELKREKWPILWRSFVVALVGLVVTSFAIGGVLDIFLQSGFEKSLLYAIPMSILSSAIVLPSVHGLNEEKKEFMIYESTFSDILGITFFYMMIKDFEAVGESNLLLSVSSNVFLTIGISILASYLLVIIFQNIKSHVKLFLLIAVLILLYALGKLMHLSSLLIILVFGLVLNNTSVFFKGRLQKIIKPEKISEILEDFKIVTIESAFIVRTFFFVIFGSTILLSQLFSLSVFIQSAAILIFTFVIRYVFIRITVGKDWFPQVFIAPRGLITILLFFAIPADFHIPNFENGTLLYVILITSLLMTWSLIRTNNLKKPEATPNDSMEFNPQPKEVDADLIPIVPTDIQQPNSDT